MLCVVLVVSLYGIRPPPLPLLSVSATLNPTPVPVAVNGTAVAFKQYTTGVVTVGGSTAAFTVTTITSLGLSHATPLVVTDWIT